MKSLNRSKFILLQLHLYLQYSTAATNQNMRLIHSISPPHHQFALARPRTSSIHQPALIHTHTHTHTCNDPLLLSRLTTCGQHKSDNQPVQSQDFCEDQDENHSHEELGLLCSTSDSRVADDSNSEACSQTTETDA